MLKRVIHLGAGFICGYFFILLVPFSAPSEVLVEFLFNPVEFVGASLVFIIGFLMYADLIKFCTELIANLFHLKKVSVLELSLPILVIVSFIVLFLNGFWEAIVFFCFSFIYGMISLDFQKLKFVEE